MYLKNEDVRRFISKDTFDSIPISMAGDLKSKRRS